MSVECPERPQKSGASTARCSEGRAKRRMNLQMLNVRRVKSAVLISQQEVPESDHECDSDTDNIGSASDVEGVDVVETTPVEDPII